MSTILAIEPDRRRAAQLTSMARAHLRAELLVAPTAAQAVEALDGRVPDVLLTAPLLPSHEETVIADYLRQLGAAAAHVQTLTIPLLAAADGDRDRPVLSAFRRGRGRVQRVEAEGCDPAVFAEQITEYLREARERRVVPAFVDMSPSAPEETSESQTLVPAALTKRETISELLSRLFPTSAREDENPSPEGEMLVTESNTPFPFDSATPASFTADADSGATYALQPISTADVVPFRQEEPSPVAPPATNVRQVVAFPVNDGADPAVNVAVAVSVNVGAHAVMAPPLKRGRKAQPVRDEWGFFDPNQCGFPALVAKLDEIAARESDR